jgi:hypothetical protein
MKNRLARLREKAFVQQCGRCDYCTAKIWLSDSGEFARSNQLTVRQAQLLRCTAEHKRARQDGGVDSRENIAAVCWFCNIKRHARKIVLDAKHFRAYVQRRIRAGKWHPKWVYDANLLAIDQAATVSRLGR